MNPEPAVHPEPPASPRLAAAATLNVAARVLTLVLGLALLLWVARLGPAVQGALALFMALDGLLVAAGSGLGLWLARASAQPGGASRALLLRVLAAAVLAAGSGLGLWLARASAQPGGASRVLLLRVLAAAVLAGALAALVLAAVGARSTDAPYRHLGLLALAAPALLLVPTATGLWLGQGRLLAFNAPALLVPAGVLLVLAGVGPWPWAQAGPGDPAALLATVLLAWVAVRAAVGLGSAAWALARPGADDRPPTTQPAAAAALPWREISRFTLTVGLANAVSLLNLRATLFLLERQRGLDEAGVYAVAVQVAELLWVLSAAVSVAAYHHLAGDPAHAARLALHALRWGVGLALLAAPVLALLAGWALPALLGPAYAGALLPLLVLLPGVVVYAGASALSAFHTHTLGRPQWAARVAGLSLVLTLLLAAFTIPRWGATGAALATSLAYTTAMAVALHSFLRGPHGPGWAGLWRRAGPAAQPAVTASMRS